MAFNFKRSLVIDHTKCPNTDRTNFPVLVSLTHADLKTVSNGGHVGNSSGFDLVFYAEFALSTKLDHQIIKYVPSTGEIIMRVRVPTVSHTVDTTIYLAYGDTGISTSQENITGVWDTNFKAVWPLEGSTLNAADSTANNNDGTITGVTAGTGKINGAGAFSGTSQYITVADAASLRITGAITLEAWVKPTDYSNYAGIVSKTDDVNTAVAATFDLYLNITDGLPTFVRGNGNSNGGASFQIVTAATAPSTGVWSYIAVTMDSSGGSSVNGGVVHYLNGAGNGGSSINFSEAAGDGGGVLRIGTRNDLFTMFKGLIDEVRISNVARSADWIATTYNNENSPGSFISVGAEYPPAVTTGLIYASDFPNLTGWTAGADFAVDTARPAYMAAPRSPIVALAATPASSDAAGVRESHIIRDGGTWNMWYGAGDGGGGAGQPWRVQWASSTDKGLNWSKHGPTSVGLLQTDTPPAVYAARDHLYTELRGGVYYQQQMSAGTVGLSGVPGQPYESDVYSFSTPGDALVFIRRSIIANPSAGFDHGDCYIASVVLNGGTYYFFFGATDGSGEYRIGYATGSSPSGVATKVGAIISDSIKGQPENPKVWWSAALNKWVMLVNQVNGSFTDRNSLFFSDSLTDWTTGVYRRDIQGVFPADAVDACGLGSPIYVAEGIPDFDDDYLGMTYDADPNADGTLHNGRSIFYSVLEPSVTALKYTGSSLNTARRTLSHDDFESEFACEFESFPGSDHVSLDFRIQGGGDCYRLMVQGGDGLKLQKVISGTPSNIGTPIGSLNTQVGWIHRVRVRAVGTTIQAWLDGELQVSETDATFSSGVSIGFAAGGTADSRIRRFHVRKSSDITILGLDPGDEVTLRGHSGIPMATEIAVDPLITFTSVKHYPIRGYEINGVYTQVSGGLYGGEVLDAGAQTFNPAWAVSCNQVVMGA